MSNKTDLAVKSSPMAIIQVLAGLIKNPLLFADNKYRFDIQDFPEQFHQIVFGAIEHLAKRGDGLLKIDVIDIDNFLSKYPLQYKVFCANKGVEYITRALEQYNEKKFDFYYETLKKFSLLNNLASRGIDIKEFYDDSLLKPEEIEKMQKHFDDLTVNDIILAVETKVLLAKEAFGSSSDMVQNKAGDGAMELKEKLKKTPIMGVPMTSKKLTTLYRGQRLGCLYLESAPQGTGKSRRAAGEACNLAVPEYFDTKKNKWVKTKLAESVLLISTELELDEIQTMLIAYVSGVEESNILDGRYHGDEEKRVNKAISLIEKSNLYVVSITNYDTEDVINLIKKYKQLYNVNYVYFDYLSENLKILAEGTRKTRVSGLRTDQILLQLSTALKDCAKQLGIYIWTASQLSGGYKEAKELDASFLRSAKSLADKVDIGSIMLPVREIDENVIDTYCAKGFELRPNFVISIYKIRRGKFQNIKVYVYFDRSTCRMEDCFVTNAKGEMIPVADTTVDFILEDTAEENLEDSAYSSQFGFDF